MNKFVQALLNDYARYLEKGLSIEEQKNDLEDFAKENGYIVEWNEQNGDDL